MRIHKIAKGPLFHIGQYRDETGAKAAGEPSKRVVSLPCFGKLRYIGNQIWKSSQGLLYKPGSIHGHRIKHLLRHFKSNFDKKTHSVFTADKNEALCLVDEAWSRRDKTVPFTDGEHARFDIPMEKVIGTLGETFMRLIVRLGTSEFLTAYPIMAPDGKNTWRSS